MRHIILDTETTGLSVDEGHRIIEIGALEMVNLTLTGNKLHLYINPERKCDPDAVEIHGLTDEFLKDKPIFSTIAQEFLDFIAHDVLVIHNAVFDIGFLNAELKKAKYDTLDMERVLDTLPMARQKFPGAQANLDALCRRYQIDNSHRDLHGALVDADLLAAVFVELKGGREPALALMGSGSGELGEHEEGVKFSLQNYTNKPHRAARKFLASEQELAAHAKLLDNMDKPIWRQ